LWEQEAAPYREQRETGLNLWTATRYLRGSLRHVPPEPQPRPDAAESGDRPMHRGIRPLRRGEKEYGGSAEYRQDG